MLQSTEALGKLRNNLNDEHSWLQLARSQSSLMNQVDILKRAVATMPGSEALWTELVRTKVTAEDTSDLDVVIRDALRLFPSNIHIWLIAFSAYPSEDVFLAALRSIDNDLVWKHYIKYITEGKATIEESFQGCVRYLEYDPSKLPQIIDLLLLANREPVAAELLLKKDNSPNFDIWGKVVTRSHRSKAFLEEALRRFPNKDALIVPLLVRQQLSETGFSDARHLITERLEHSTSVRSFCEIFTAAVQLYDNEISTTMRTQGQGGWRTAQLLTEYANLLKKRPLMLNNIALNQSPNNVRVWLDRSKLMESSPHIAAHILETAIERIDPLKAVDGDMADIYIRYATILATNGSNTEQAVAPLRVALDKKYIRTAQKVKLLRTLADIQQGPGNDAKAALQTLKDAVNSNQNDASLWLHYLSVQVEADTSCLLESFSRCCQLGLVTMRMVLLVAQAFSLGSSNNIAVFEKGVSMFPPKLSSALWLKYIDALNASTNLNFIREMYNKAFETFINHKQIYEELVLKYYNVEKIHLDGSMIMARKRLVPLLNRSTTRSLWAAYISTFDGDIAGQRVAYEQAIQKLNDADAAEVAVEMAYFEENLGEIDRSRALYQYASRLTTARVTAWEDFEIRNSSSAGNLINFVPAVEMES